MSGFVSALGCEVRLLDAPEHLRPGRLLVLAMPAPDGRRAEVYLSPDDLLALRLMIDRPDLPDLPDP